MLSPRLSDRYAILHIHDFAARLYKAKIFSEVDLVIEYHHVHVAQEDIAETVVITTFGLFKFLWMTFGFKNTTQTFYWLMDSVCQPLDFVYFDDILIASASQKEHRSICFGNSKDCLILVLW